jgi:hypothetical protein
MSNAPTLPEVLDYISSSATADDIEMLRPLANLRSQILRTAESALVRVGHQARIRNLNPAYLKGLTGTVAKLERGRGEMLATLTLDDASVAAVSRASKGRFGKDIDGIPIASLELI